MLDAVKIREEVGELHEKVAVAKLNVSGFTDGTEGVKASAKRWLNEYLVAVCEYLIAEATMTWASYALTREDGISRYKLSYEAKRAADFAGVSESDIYSIVQECLGALWHLGEVEAKVGLVGADGHIEVAASFTAND